MAGETARINKNKLRMEKKIFCVCGRVVAAKLRYRRPVVVWRPVRSSNTGVVTQVFFVFWLGPVISVPRECAAARREFGGEFAGRQQFPFIYFASGTLLLPPHYFCSDSPLFSYPC